MGRKLGKAISSSINMEDDEYFKFLRKTKTGKATLKNLIAWHKMNKIFK